MNKKVLVIAAHRDDEVLGAGGAIAKHVRDGDEVCCLILGSAELCRESVDMNKQALECAKILGIKEMFFENFPDNEFDSVSLLSITRKIEEYVARISPEIIYTHYENDLNIDHRLTFQAVITACRPCNEKGPREIYCFEVLSSTEWQLGKERFSPNIYIDIENEIETKIQAMLEYKSEIRDYPHSRSIEGIKILAKYRGLECNKKFAEAFILIRGIK